ncbi:MAG: amidase [Rhodospirillales bacterium]|jgi:Asp-tRNA(Asn)/Glu-tRNA(Gln) amidotransferase A subunit family amidase|nr:amidase [Rhodospirillales bacterium]MDP7215490.1 amidase [Rhodospirillales bacterium]MDP7652955.1 amidase [Rhodospirillales bacterium]
MASSAPNELTAREAIQKIEAGELTSETLVAACLERIAEREDTIGAWQFLSADMAMEAASSRDTAALDQPLRGVPVAVKDIYDTADMPTAYGSPIYEGHRPPADASCVAMTRNAGGIVLGKTVTTEFAYFQPGKTANPHAPGHTPGGSSSGSAAAVADFMVPLAFGSQTVGSTIRPASYCGIVGYKPSFGLIDRTGMRPLAESFDTVGLFARDVSDVAFLASILSRRPALRFDDDMAGPTAIGLCRTHEWAAADADVETVLDTAARLASAAGCHIRDVSLPDPFSKLADAQALIVDVEAARSAAHDLNVHRERVSESFVKRAEAGLATTAENYDAALGITERARGALDAALDGLDVLLCPSAPGQAPEGLHATGDPIFNRTGTALRIPCINVPGLCGHSGLPIGVQVLGRLNDDRRVLAAAHWLRGVLRRG